MTTNATVASSTAPWVSSPFTRVMRPGVDTERAAPRPDAASAPCSAPLCPRSAGFPLDFFPVLFAVPRVVGWLAHWRQMMLQDGGVKIWRPRQVRGPSPSCLRSFLARPLDGRAIGICHLRRLPPEIDCARASRPSTRVGARVRRSACDATAGTTAVTTTTTATYPALPRACRCMSARRNGSTCPWRSGLRWRACGRRRPRSNTGGECHRDLSPLVMLVAAARTDCGGRLRRITKRTMLATFKGKSKL